MKKIYEVNMKKWCRHLAPFASTIAASLGSFAAGCTLGWVSTASSMLLEGDAGFHVDENEISWMASLPFLGGLLTCFPIGYLSDIIGRRTTMALSVPAVALSWGFITWSSSVQMIYVGRFISGLSLCFPFLATAYIAETLHKDIRGAMTSYPAMFMNMGFVFSYIAGSVCTLFVFSFICGFAPIVFGVCICYCPESPFYFLIKDRSVEARKILRLVRGDNCNLEDEFMELTAAVDTQNKISGSSWKIFGSRHAIKAFLICLVLAVFYSSCGAFTYAIYITSILKDADSSLDPNIGAIVFGLISVVAHYAGCILADRVGRRPLLVISSAVMTFSNATMASYYRLLFQGEDMRLLYWLPWVNLCVSMTSYAIGFSNLPGVLQAEMLPPEIKGRSQGFCNVISNAIGFLFIRYFYDLISAFGQEMTYGVFAIICGCASMFCCLFVPETQGMSFKEIFNLLETDY